MDNEVVHSITKQHTKRNDVYEYVYHLAVL